MILALRRFSKRKQAQKVWNEAKAAVADAEARHDARDLGKARLKLQDATTALLKAETVRVRR